MPESYDCSSCGGPNGHNLVRRKRLDGRYYYIRLCDYCEPAGPWDTGTVGVRD